MASYIIELISTPAHVSFSVVDDAVAVIYNDGMAQIWDLNTRLPGPTAGSRLRGGGKVAEPKVRWQRSLVPEGSSIPKQVALGRSEQLAALFWTDSSGAQGSILVIADRNANREIRWNTEVDRVLRSKSGWFVLNASGSFEIGESARSPACRF